MLFSISFQDEDAMLEISKAVTRLPVLPILSECAEGSPYDSIERGKEHEISKEIESLQEQAKSFSSHFLIDICDLSVSSEYVGNAILFMIQEHENPGELFEASGIDKVIKTFNELAQKKQICKEVVSEVILKSKRIIPLEILLPLTEIGFLSLSKYLATSLDAGGGNMLSEERLSALHKDLKSLLCRRSSTEYVRLSGNKVLCFIMSLTALNSNTLGIANNVQQTVNAMICQIIEEHDFKELFAKNERESLVARLADIDISENHHITARVDFFVQIIETFLKMGQNQTINNAFVSHSEWVFARMSENAITTLQAMMLYVDDKDLISIITTSMRESNCNFQRLLSLISVWLISSESAPDVFAKALTNLLVDSIDLKQMSLVKVTLLVARHCTLQTHCGFPSYSKWLENTLKVVLLVNNRDSFMTYLRCLNDLLPVETRDFLKVHLTLGFEVPAIAKKIFNDYSGIAKTRLCDLKAKPTQNVVQFIHVNKEFDAGALKDVGTSVSQYAVYGKIPKAVFEMSVFQKNYFVSSFLPALLNPEALHNDESRKNFVEELKRAGKIPNKIYQTYERACEDFNIKNTFNDVTRSLSGLADIVVKKINELPQVIISNQQIAQQKHWRVAIQTYLASLSAHLKHFEDVCEERGSEDILASFFKGNFADALLDGICHSFAMSSDPKSFASFKWIKWVLHITTDGDDLLAHLKSRILKLLESDISVLESYHLQTIACIVSTLQSIENQTKDLKESFLKQAVHCSLGLQENEIALRRVCQAFEFVSYVLFFCSLISNEVIVADDNLTSDVCIVNDAILLPKSIIDIWIMVASRLKTSVDAIEGSLEAPLKDSVTELKETLEFAESVQQLNPYKATVANYQFDLRTWLRFELQIDDNKDYVPLFLKETLFRNIIDANRAKDQTSDSWSPLLIANSIVNCILSHERTGTFYIAPICQKTHPCQAFSDPFVLAKGKMQTKTTHGVLRCKAKYNFHRNGAIDHPCSTPNSLLCFLRSLCEEIEMHKVDEGLSSDNKSWFLDALSSWLNELKNQGQDGATDRYKARISPQQIYHLGTLLDVLPCHLLFTNSHIGRPPFVCSKDLIALINNISLYYREHKFYLPLGFFIRILNALISYSNKLIMYSNGTLRDDVVTMVDHFVVFFPVFSISLAHYFNSPVVAKPIRALIALGSKSLEEMSDMKAALQSDDLHRIFNSRVLTVPVQAISIFINWREAPCEQKELLLLRILDLSPEILQIILECVFTNLLTLLIDGKLENGSDEYCLSVVKLIKKIPKQCFVLIEDILSDNRSHGVGDLRDIFVTRHERQLFPVVFIKILAQMDLLYMKHLLSLENSKHCVLKCVKMSTLLAKDHGLQENESFRVSPFDVTFVKELGLVENALQFRR